MWLFTDIYCSRSSMLKSAIGENLDEDSRHNLTFTPTDRNTHRLHQRGFSICDKNKDVSIQTKLVDPSINVGRDINAWTVHSQTCGRHTTAQFK